MQICVATIILLGWFYLKTSAYLNQPDDLDLYAHTWSFQISMFSLFILPLFVGVMMIVLGTEWWVVRVRRQHSGERDPSGS